MRAFRQKEASPQALRWGWMLTIVSSGWLNRVRWPEVG